MNELAAHFEGKARFWSVVFNLAKWPASLNIGLFVLFCFPQFKGAFTLIYGADPANLWYSVGITTIFGVVIFISYHRAHGYLDLSKRARGGSSGTVNNVD